MKLSFLCSLLLLALHVNAQTIGTYYNLGFDRLHECSWDWLKGKNRCNITYGHSSKGRADSRFLQLTADNRPGFSQRNMEFMLTKNIILPAIHHQNINISLNIRNSSSHSVSLKVLGIDKNENIVFTKTSEVSQAASWKKATVFASSEKLKAINVYIEYKGDTDTSQIVCLKDLDIALDGKSVSEMYVSNASNGEATLSPLYILPLKTADSMHLLDDIEALKSKKIIGLGECAHGSGSVSDARYLFLKNLVSRHNCKLILLEKSFDISLIFDLYVQGLMPKSTETMKGYLHLFMDAEPLMQFLDWLREYNIGKEKKVHIWGIDNGSAGTPPVALMDWHLELLGKEKATPYLEKLWKNEFHKVAKMVKKDDSLRLLLGGQNYAYYMYILSDNFSKDRDEWFSGRDSNMARRVVFLDSTFTSPLEKTAILAHSGHLQRINQVGDQSYTMLGALLADKYDTAYYAINFTFGSGKFNQDSCSTQVRLIEDSLTAVPGNSFEYAALKTNQAFFFYPTVHLDDNIISTLGIFRMTQGKNHFKFANLKRRFDGCVFLRRSEPFMNVERVPLGYGMGFFAERRRTLRLLVL